MPAPLGNQYASNAVSGFNPRPNRVKSTVSERRINAVCRLFSTEKIFEMLEKIEKTNPSGWLAYATKFLEMQQRKDEHKYTKEYNALKLALENTKIGGDGRMIEIVYNAQEADIQDADIVD